MNDKEHALEQISYNEKKRLYLPGSFGKGEGAKVTAVVEEQVQL